MSSLGFKSVVFHGDSCLGELDTIPVIKDQNFQFPNNEIRIHHISPQSERCPPLSILQTISSSPVRCKLESTSPVEQPRLINLHASCFFEFKTAVVLLGDEELHLVAMPSKQKKFPCFWCYAVPSGLYNACLGMLNLRCLAIVFDLDETLIVANTMKSFEDKIETLRGWIARETDPIRMLGMTSELKRYIDDRSLLKQYTETDYVVENGKIFKVQLEEVSPLSGSHERVVRPVIRLPERNMVLTRINPEIRDTSVLVRLRPAWEDLRSYLTAKGRKRQAPFTENNFITDCASARKSLLNVFQDGNCHPKMAMVIDDRLKVWEDKDQPRVHVVPAFTPYYAPQAEDASFVPNGNTNAPIAEGMNGPEVAQRMNQLDQKNGADSAAHPPINPEIRSEGSQMASVPNVFGPASFRTVIPSDKPSLLGVPFKRDNSSSESDEVKRRFLIVNPSQDIRYQGLGEAPLLSRLPIQPSVTPIKPQGGWLIDEDINRGHFNNRDSVTVQESDALKTDKKQACQNPPCDTPGSTPAGVTSCVSEVKGEQGYPGRVEQRQNPSSATLPSEVGVPLISFSNGRELQVEGGKANMLPSSLSMGVLQEIGRRCSSKIEFRSVVSNSKDLHFSVEVLFTGEKIGVGMGKTRKDAQQQAAENALRCLAEKYLSYIAPRAGAVDRPDKDFEKLSLRTENGFIWDIMDSGSNELQGEDGLSKESTSEVAEGALGNTSNVGSQQVQKRSNSPR
ncbi:protein-serine,threonine phosphatase [Sarracenia purpurea var. burkii]